MTVREEVKARIIECEEIYNNTTVRDSLAYLDLLNIMRVDYETLKLEKQCNNICQEMIELILRSNFNRDDISNMLLATYDTKARMGDFRAYCIAVEWNRPIEKQFFIPRRRILEKHGLIQAMQDMADDKLDFLFVSLPPRIGKSTLGLFFLTFMAGRFPERSILGNGHSTSLTQAFYNEVVNIMTSDEYRYKEIFGHNIVSQSAEYSYLDLNSKKRFLCIDIRH